MTSFAFEVIEQSGRRRAGRADAATEESLRAKLEAEGAFLVRVRPDEEFAPPGPATRGGASGRLLDLTRTLATLLPTGLPLAECLDAAARMSDAASRSLIQAVRERIRSGESLAQAFSAHGDFFPAHYRALVGAAELAGNLPAAFVTLVRHVEREAEFRRRVTAAAIYPAILTVASIASIAVLAGFVLPRFSAIMEGAGARLPALATLVLDTAAGARRVLPFGALALLAAAGAVALSCVDARVQRLRGQLLHSLPIIGAAARERAAARVGRLMSLLLEGGVPVTSALDSVAAAVHDPVSRGAWDRVRANVTGGLALSDAFAREPFFPPVFSRLVTLGEESGDLATFLGRAADLFDRRLEQRINVVLSLAEPAVILGFGALVGVIALALLQTVYGVNVGAIR